MQQLPSDCSAGCTAPHEVSQKPPHSTRFSPLQHATAPTQMPAATFMQHKKSSTNWHTCSCRWRPLRVVMTQLRSALLLAPPAQRRPSPAVLLLLLASATQVQCERNASATSTQLQRSCNATATQLQRNCNATATQLQRNCNASCCCCCCCFCCCCCCC